MRKRVHNRFLHKSRHRTPDACDAGRVEGHVVKFLRHDASEIKPAYHNRVNQERIRHPAVIIVRSGDEERADQKCKNQFGKRRPERFRTGTAANHRHEGDAGNRDKAEIKRQKNGNGEKKHRGAVNIGLRTLFFPREDGDAGTQCLNDKNHSFVLFHPLRGQNII